MSFSKLDYEKTSAKGVLIAAVETGRAKSVSVIKFLPGSSFPSHSHGKATERYFAVSGKGIVSVGKLKRVLDKGDSIEIGRGRVHSVSNPFKRQFVMVEISIPGFDEKDVLFGPKGRKIQAERIKYRKSRPFH
ncbi:MAG: cupin domain-containing protein [archaeon]